MRVDEKASVDEERARDRPNPGRRRLRWAQRIGQSRDARPRCRAAPSHEATSSGREGGGHHFAHRRVRTVEQHRPSSLRRARRSASGADSCPWLSALRSPQPRERLPRRDAPLQLELERREPFERAVPDREESRSRGRRDPAFRERPRAAEGADELEQLPPSVSASSLRITRSYPYSPVFPARKQIRDRSDRSSDRAGR